MTTTPVPELLDIESLAAHLNDSVRHVRRLVAERRIPYLKVGHFIRFDPADINAWLQDQRVNGAALPDVRSAPRRHRSPT
ncbi:MAG: helix-turn-helix domain-containing protein [Acidimicrobiales bacterium]